MPYNSGSIANFSASAISDTYQRIVQTDGVRLADGTGSILNNLLITGSFFGTASYALQALSSSYAVSASYVPNASSFPYTGSAEITGSLIVTGSVSATLFIGTIDGGSF